MSYFVDVEVYSINIYRAVNVDDAVKQGMYGK
jgi:hypothetical protein